MAQNKNTQENDPFVMMWNQELDRYANDTTPFTQLMARWLYRTFLVDFIANKKNAIAEWESLKKDGAKCELLQIVKYGANSVSTDTNGDWPKVVRNVARLAKEENALNYDGILARANATDTPKAQRTPEQMERIHESLSIQISYYMLIGFRPAEVLNDSLELPPIIIERLNAAQEAIKKKGKGRGTVAELWDFIESEALRGRQYKKILQDPRTADNIITARSKNGTALATGGGEMTTATGVVELAAAFDTVPVNTNVGKVFVASLMKLASQLPYNGSADQIDKNRTIHYSVTEHSSLTGHGKKEAREELNTAANALQLMRVKVDGKWYNVGGVMDDRGISDLEDLPKSVKNGTLEFTFGYDFTKYLSTKYVPLIHVGLLRVNARQNPNSFNIGYKLCVHCNTNTVYGNKNGHRISVKSLLAYCTDLPSYEDVKANKNRRYKDFIMDPFERDLIALQTKYGVLASWRYCKANGQPIPDREIESYSYDEWITWLIDFELADYPEPELALEGKKTKARQYRNKAKKDTTTKTKKKT